MIIERRLSRWESKNFTRVRKLSPKETQRFYSQLYEQREYALGLQSIGRAFKGFGSKATSLGNKIDSAGGTGQVFKNIGSNIKTGFENTGTKIKNWWNSGPSAYETTGMYQKRIGKGPDPNVKPTQEYKSIFTPKKQPEKFTLDVSAEAKNPFNSHTDGIIKSADGATPTVTSQPKPEPQNINPSSGGATDSSVMKQNTGVSSSTPTVTPQPNLEQKNIVNSASGSATTQQSSTTKTSSTNTGAGGSIFDNSGLQSSIKNGGTFGGYDLKTGKPLGSVTLSPTPNSPVTPNSGANVGSTPINAQQPKLGTWEYVRAMQKNNSNNRRDIYVDKLGLQRRLFTDYIREKYNQKLFFNYSKAAKQYGLGPEGIEYLKKLRSIEAKKLKALRDPIAAGAQGKNKLAAMKHRAKLLDDKALKEEIANNLRNRNTSYDKLLQVSRESVNPENVKRIYGNL